MDGEVRGVARRQRVSAPIVLIASCHRLSISAIVLYEWLRGPRTRAEVAVQEDLFPRERAVPFGVSQAAVAVRLYGAVKRPRGREIDLAVAACALHDGAALWTLNRADFRDVPDLALI
jgi:predicted nucleic acid-binding protein